MCSMSALSRATCLARTEEGVNRASILDNLRRSRLVFFLVEGCVDSFLSEVVILGQLVHQRSPSWG